MIIIFGEKAVKKPVKDGLRLQRLCPKCRRAVEMQEYQWRRYLTLFFVPVFPLERKRESVLVCPLCDGSFVPQYEDYLEGTKRAAEEIAARKSVISCPHCSQRLRVPNTTKHLHVKCPKCGQEFDVRKREPA